MAGSLVGEGLGDRRLDARRALSRRAILAGAGAACVLPRPAAAGPGLAVSGNRLTWRGNPVRLRGVSTGDPLLARSWRPTSDYARIAHWRSNVVRFGLHPGAWRDREADAKACLRRDVEAALAANMWVVIDWHMIGWPDVRAHDPIYDTDFRMAKEFWTYVAATYGGDGRIAFELMNEPNTGDVNNPRTWPELRSYFMQLVQIVRARSSNLILCTGDCGAYDLRTIKDHPVPGHNIGYTWHLYAGHSLDLEGEWARFLDDLHLRFPVMCTEWGFNSDPSCRGYHFCSTLAAGQKVSRFITSRQLSWTAWVWQPDWKISLVQADWKTATSGFGRHVRGLLQHGAVVRPRAL